MESGGARRKARSDKKVDVKPTMSIKLKRQLYKFSELCEMPIKDVGEKLCENASVSPLILDDINQWFRRDYICPPAIHKGYLERPRLKLLLGAETGKVSIKFSQATFDQLCKLAYSLDLSPTTTSTILIKRSLHNREFMFDYVKTLRHLSNEQKNDVHAFLRKIWGFR